MDCPPEMPNSGETSARRAKYQGAVEDRITIHQDWTDSKTELVMRTQSPRRDNPALRKSDELHQKRIFAHERTAPRDDYERAEPMTTDNSSKLKSAIGLHTQQIHQAHLRTSMTPSEFYEEAASTKDWEVVELHISGLPIETD